MRITKALLESKNACQDQVDLFVSIWPEGVTLTKEICTKYASKFDVDWMAANLLTDTQRAEYERIQGPARAEYRRIEGPALSKYEVIRGKAWAEYKRVEGSARAEYKRIQGSAWAEYKRIQGPAFFEALMPRKKR